MASSAPRSRVAVLAFPHISPFHLSVPTLVFGGAGLDGVSGLYDVDVCAEQPGSMPTAAGYGIQVDVGLEAMDEADLVVIPSWREGSEPSAALLDAVRRAHRRGARIVGLCLGTIVVSASGIADGREVSTHWAAADRLSAAEPQIRVRDDVLWSDLGDVVTSAGRRGRAGLLPPHRPLGPWERRRSGAGPLTGARTAPHRVAGAVHPCAGGRRVGRRSDRRGDAVGARAPRHTHRCGRLGRVDAHVPSHVHSTLSRPHRDESAAVAARSEGRVRSHAARERRRHDRAGRRTRRIRQRGVAPPALPSTARRQPGGASCGVPPRAA